jgi:isopentenyl diphosphate isomerase/L-lactate dehydrogenase-like FMN-dependent dehydrogenase
MSQKWLEEFSGETTEELLALEGRYRIDSLVLAFEQALQKKAAAHLSTEERIVLAVEALEREVNNGGYDQFFSNSSREYCPIIVSSLERIGCPKTAEITREALNAAGVPAIAGQAGSMIGAEAESNAEALARCDDLYYNSGEDVAGHLFDFIKAHRDSIAL